MWKLTRLSVIAFLGCMFLTCCMVSRAFTWFSIIRRPVIDIPVSLAKGTIKTKPFGSKSNDYYLILIRTRRGRLPLDEMDCMMGINWGPFSRYTCYRKPLLQADWRVSDGDKTVAAGEAYDQGGGGSTDRTLERYLGHFTGQAGHKYTLEVQVTADGSPLNVTDPHLVVEIRKPSD